MGLNLIKNSKKIFLFKNLTFSKSQSDTRKASELSSGIPHTELARLDYEKSNILLHVTSEMEKKWRIKACKKEPWTVAWIEDNFLPGEVLYDIGANVGAYSLIAAKQCQGNGTVVAFEPGYASFTHLCENIILNDCNNVIIPVPLPLSSKTGMTVLKYRSLHPGQSRHSIREIPWPSDQKKQKKIKESQHIHLPVFAIKIDEFVKLFDTPRPNHIKLDVDGWEMHVLKGAERILSDPSLKTILIEMDQSLMEEIKKFLEEKRLWPEAYYRRRDKPKAPVYGLFCRK